MRNAIAVAMLLVVGGCLLGPTALSVSVDQSSYVLVSPDSGVSVTFQIQNVGSEDLYLARCGSRVPSWIERERSRGIFEAVDYSSFMCQADLPMLPLILGQKNSYEDARHISATGYYRICVHFGTDQSDMYAERACSMKFAVRIQVR